MIYTDIESIVVPDNNGKKNADESYTNEYQRHIGCSFGYKLISIDNQFSKPFESYLGEDAVHRFITNMVEEKKYCSHVLKKYFN